MTTRPSIIHRHQAVLTASVIGIFALIATCAMLFVKIAEEVREQDTLVFDKWALTTINDHSTVFLDRFIPIATDVGGIVGIVVLVAVFGAIFLYRRVYRRLAILCIGVGGAVLLNLILKAVFMRERPDLWVQLIHETGYSFPSGHAMSSAGLGFSLVVALWSSRWRWWAVGFATVYILFVGFSRLYLGVHYPTDVAAGWLVSAVWVLSVWLLLRSSIGARVIKRGV